MMQGDNMDMNWNTMLHDAAHLSFESETEKPGISDNESSVPVDLSRRQVRRLAEKIILLPHFGVVLLFSKYCFRLSAKETEMFFDMENAKGKLKFYSRLLSEIMGLGTDQVISEASLTRSCALAMKNYLHNALKAQTDAGTIRSRRMPTTFGRIRRAAAAAAIAVAVLFSASMAANAQFREKVITWVIETFEKYSIFELKSDETDLQPDLQDFIPTYLPEGTVLQSTIEQPEVLGYEYTIGDSDTLSIWISQSDVSIYLDTENAEIQPLDEDGLSGYCFEKDGLCYICFERDGCFFAVYGSIDMDELLQIAVGIEKE